MKAKNFFNTLFNNLFNSASTNNTTGTNNTTDTTDAEKTGARNDLLQKIYRAVEEYQFEDMENHIRKYQATYGSLTGKEEVWFEVWYGDSWDSYRDWDKRRLLFAATEFTERFFFAFINGEEAVAKEYRHKAELQAALEKAFYDGDIVSVDKFISAGADVNYVYYKRSGSHKTTLWREVKDTKGRMYEYFMTRMDIPEVKAFWEKKKAEEELIAARKVQIG